MIFKSKTNPPNNYFNGKRIGVLGLAPRCGTTHIAIAISNYLSETEKKRVSLIEQNRHNDIICLAYSLGAKDNGPFTFHRVTYIPFVSIDTNGLADLGSDCMVFDLGCDFKSGLSRLLLCDIKIIVGNDAVWRMGEYDKLESFPSIYGALSSWRLFVNLGNIKHMREKDRYGMTVCCFPFEPDPVYPGNDTVDFLKEAIYG
jgi:hypothetical protein